MVRNSQRTSAREKTGKKEHIQKAYMAHQREREIKKK